MCRRYKNKLHNQLNQKLNSEILTEKSELELRKLDRNQKFLKNLDSKPEISVESESKNTNALLLINSLLNSSSEIRKFDRVLVVARTQKVW